MRLDSGSAPRIPNPPASSAVVTPRGSSSRASGLPPDFLDEHPDHLAERLRSLQGDHDVGEPGGHVVLLLLGEGSLGERDSDQRHDVLLCGR
jgi:hypothetical protein